MAKVLVGEQDGIAFWLGLLVSCLPSRPYKIRGASIIYKIRGASII